MKDTVCGGTTAFFSTNLQGSPNHGLDAERKRNEYTRKSILVEMSAGFTQNG